MFIDLKQFNKYEEIGGDDCMFRLQINGINLTTNVINTLTR